ncbi:MAG: LacI family DNA-binding transcriptional regulator [Atopobiaceae bacterium]|nr:LacI family DNA-binding transcriptional regulator [Atopobiaceae bacterium]
MTIKDVAAYCGVAVSTVSRVLNNHPDVSEDTRAKVLAAIAKLNYIPNNSARDLVTPQGDSIGVVVRGAENPFFTPVIRAIEARCELAGYTMVLHQIPAGADEVAAGAELVRSKRLRGLIFLGGRFDYSQHEANALGIPFVCCTNTNQFGDLEKTAYSSVSIDDFAEGFKATNLLVQRGHRRIAILLDSVTDHSVSELRYAGYCQALADAGIPLDTSLVLQTVAFSMPAAFERVSAYLAQSQDVTGIFAVADTMAIAAIKALHNAGLHVPQDVSVVAIDGIEMSLYTIPTLTTLSQPQETMGEEAVSILLDVLSGTSPNRHVRLETTLREGETLGVCKN